MGDSFDDIFYKMLEEMGIPENDFWAKPPAV